MHDILSAFMLVYAGLFPVVNPLGSAPIFLSLTPGCSADERSRLARGVALNSFCLLLGSLLLGSLILEAFGITVPVVRVAGGLLVAALGWKILNGADTTTEHKTQDAPVQAPQSFYPLTLPLTVGPGAIAVAITYGSHRPEGPDALWVVSAAILGLLAISVTVFVSYRFAEELARALGRSGINVLTRLSAFILVCIGIQILWGGIKSLIATL